MVRAQVVRQAVGPRVQLAVRQVRVPHRQRHGVRRAAHLLLHQVHHGRPVHPVHGPGVQAQQQLLALGRGHHLQSVTRGRRALHRVRQQALEALQQPPRGPRQEEVRVVVQRQHQPLAQLQALHAHVELGLLLRQHVRRQRQPVHLERAALVHGQAEHRQRVAVADRQVVEHHLEDRRARRVPGPAQLRHQLRERVRLVLQRLQHPLLQLAREGAEAQPLVHRGAHHHGVDGVADDLLQRHVLRGHERVGGRPHQHVALAGVPRQQHVEAREQEGVQRHALLTRPGLRAAHQPPVQLVDDGVTVAALLRGPGLVRGQLQRGRRSRQALLPVALQHLAPRTAEQRLLPLHELAVLRARRRQARRAPGDELTVKLEQLPLEHLQRPRVVGDVVLGEDHQVLAAVHAGDAQPGHRPRRQVEGLAHLLDEAAAHLRRGHAARVIQGEGERALLLDALEQPPVIADAVGGAQHLVPLHQHLGRAAQGLHVQRAVHAEGEQRVVRVVVRVGLVQVEQRGLAVGEGEGLLHRRHPRGRVLSRQEALQQLLLLLQGHRFGVSRHDSALLADGEQWIREAVDAQDARRSRSSEASLAT